MSDGNLYVEWQQQVLIFRDNKLIGALVFFVIGPMIGIGLLHVLAELIQTPGYKGLPPPPGGYSEFPFILFGGFLGLLGGFWAVQLLHELTTVRNSSHYCKVFSGRASISTDTTTGKKLLVIDNKGFNAQGFNKDKLMTFDASNLKNVSAQDASTWEGRPYGGLARDVHLVLLSLTDGTVHVIASNWGNIQEVQALLAQLRSAFFPSSQFGETAKDDEVI